MGVIQFKAATSSLFASKSEEHPSESWHSNKKLLVEATNFLLNLSKWQLSFKRAELRKKPNYNLIICVVWRLCHLFINVAPNIGNAWDAKKFIDGNKQTKQTQNGYDKIFHFSISHQFVCLCLDDGYLNLKR